MLNKVGLFPSFSIVKFKTVLIISYKKDKDENYT